MNPMEFTGWDWLRVLCGLYYIPHTYSKFAPRSRANITGFFNKAGFKSPGPLINLAALVEVVCTISLVFDIYPVWGAWLSALYLFVAAAFDIKVGGWAWEWIDRGCEYPVFWGLISVILALNL